MKCSETNCEDDAINYPTGKNMKKWKVLNLYAGIGGNRKLWTDVDVTAVEIDSDIAKIYQDFFPDDKVIVGDAHQYLLEHYNEFDFIWSSPPCQSHSKARFLASKGGDYKPIYPDMSLWEEIIFLSKYYDVGYVVENVKPYYQTLIEAQQISKHYFWANFTISDIKLSNRYHFNTVNELQKEKGFDLSSYKNINKLKILRNTVCPKLGKHVLDCSIKKIQTNLIIGSD